MRLSLRTLLAYEDNVFDVEQHRRLELLLPTDKAADATLQRVRSVVRNPMLGVPGLVDHQEELDPNYVAEYLDHQMPDNVQNKFETYCLSADKYLAEIASAHHILSNVLGEPARTSRECRLKCYDSLKANPKTAKPSGGDTVAGSLGAVASSLGGSLPKHFRPYDAPPESNTANKPAAKRQFTFWNRFFPAKNEPRKAEEQKQKSSLWSFCVLGLFICALFLGWKEIEKQRSPQRLSDSETETVVADDFFAYDDTFDKIDQDNANNIDVPVQAVSPPETEESPLFSPVAPSGLAQTGVESESFIPYEPIEQTAFTEQRGELTPNEPQSVVPADDPFAIVGELPPATFAGTDRFGWDNIAPRNLPNIAVTRSGPSPPDVAERIEPQKAPPKSPETPLAEPSGSLIAFQPIAPSIRPRTGQAVQENPVRPQSAPSNPRPPLPATAWQADGVPAVASAPPSPPPQVAPAPVQSAPRQTAQGNQPIVQAAGQEAPKTGAAPRVLGRVEPMQQPSVVFSAKASGNPEEWQSWQLPPLPFDLTGDQYLLTATPFRGTFDLTSSFRIEMIGDAKLRILPLDASGTPGIYVDYGRIIIRALKPNQQLRIEMEKTRGMVSAAGSESVLFIDSFAEISTPAETRSGQKPQTGPILGFVPKNGEQIVWKLNNQPQPIFVKTQVSVLLQSDQYRFAEVRLPVWLGAMPMSLENRMLVETCQRSFAEAYALGATERAAEMALTKLIQHESRAVRTLGYRLWGDLGEFSVPLAFITEKRKEEEEMSLTLVEYFEEVRLRDEATVDDLTKAIEFVRESRRGTSEVRQ